VPGVVVEAPQRVERRQAGAHGVHGRQQVGLDDEQPRAGVAQHVLELTAAQRRVHRDVEGAQPRAAEPQLEHLDPVLAHGRDRVAGPDAGRGQPAGRGGHRVAKLRHGDRAPVHAHERTLAVPRGLQLEQRRKRPLARGQPAQRRVRLHAGPASASSRSSSSRTISIPTEARGKPT
jgi:hypothetical protein